MNTHCDHTAVQENPSLKEAVFDHGIATQNQCRTLSAAVDYAPETNTGTVILNITCIADSETDKALGIIKSVLASSYAFSDRFILAIAGSSLGNFHIPAHTSAIGTVCSLTLNGLLLNCGIQAQPKYGGVVAVTRGLPERFTAFMGSGESLLAPLDDYLSGTMTSVGKALSSGTGEVLGSFLELPARALSIAKRLYRQLRKSGMGSKIIFGNPSEPLLGMPVSIGSAGMVVFRDINTVAALAEQSIHPLSPTVKTLCRFEHMQPHAS